MTSHATAEIAIRPETHRLGEDGATLIHDFPPENRFARPFAGQIAASQILVQLSAAEALVGGERSISRTAVAWGIWGGDMGGVVV
jgi:hypothetical protein